LKFINKISAGLAAVVATAAVVAGTASASPTPSQINVLGSTQTTITVSVPYTEQVQFYTDGSPVQVEREVLSAGTYALKGNRLALKPGQGYFVRAAGNTGWTEPLFITTLAAAGSNGSNGSAGPAGETLVSQTTLSANAAVATGGPFLTNATVLGSVTVKTAGEYRVSVNAKVAADSTTQEVFPLIAVYNGVALSDYSNDLFNLGDGALPLSKTIDQYIVGSQVVSLPAGTLKIYGFGYTPGGAAGTFNFEGATVTVTAVTAS
jgi:hypothetical protein